MEADHNQSSTNSSMNKTLNPTKPYHSTASSSSSPSPLGSEESSWTAYFVDFITTQGRETASDHGCSNKSSSSSMVVSVDNNSYKHMHLIKRRSRGKGNIVDDSLEDTASSPVNSPKVFQQLINTETSHRSTANEMRNNNIIEQKSCGGNEDSYAELRSATTGNEIQATNELRKKGFCLVPVSIVKDFIS